jgi:hypothetical protein
MPGVVGTLVGAAPLDAVEAAGTERPARRGGSSLDAHDWFASAGCAAALHLRSAAPDRGVLSADGLSAA